MSVCLDVSVCLRVVFLCVVWVIGRKGGWRGDIDVSKGGGGYLPTSGSRCSSGTLDAWLVCLFARAPVSHVCVCRYVRRR